MVNVSKDHLPTHKTFIRAAALDRERQRYQQEINALVIRIKEIKIKLDEIDQIQFDTFETINHFQRNCIKNDASLAEIGINLAKTNMQKSLSRISAKTVGNTFKVKY